jgi:enoyl-CoA hydratase
MTVRVETCGPIGIITIDRPDRRNAVDGPTALALIAAVERLEEDQAILVGILTGAGGTFCAGADLKAAGTHELAALGDGPLGPSRRTPRIPFIAAVEGYAVAGGLELALWCDLRVAARDATFGVFCRRWGVPLIDGGTVRLPRLIGHSVAMDMILTGRAVGGEEAHRVGLANRLVDRGQALAAAKSLAAELAALPQRCLRADRASAITQWSLGLDDALRLEAAGGMDVIRSGETAAGIDRFIGGAGRHGKSA